MYKRQALDSLVDIDGLVRKGNVLHLESAKLADPNAGKQRNQNTRRFSVQVHVCLLYTSTKKIAAELLDKGWCRVTGLYTPKRPQLYDAVIRLDDTGSKYVSFKMEFDR